MSAYSLQRLSNIKLYKKLEVPAGMTWVYFFTTESNVFQRGSDHLLYYDETFLSWWEWSLLRWQCFQPQDGSLSGLMDYKNDMAFEVSQHLWEIWIVRRCSFTSSSKQTKYLGKTAFPSSVRVPKSPRISLKPVVVALVVDLFIIWAESRF